eukprot:2728032-Rhodomonas_salina.1
MLTPSRRGEQRYSDTDLASTGVICVGCQVLAFIARTLVNKLVSYYKAKKDIKEDHVLFPFRKKLRLSPIPPKISFGRFPLTGHVLGVHSIVGNAPVSVPDPRPVGGLFRRNCQQLCRLPSRGGVRVDHHARGHGRPALLHLPGSASGEPRRTPPPLQVHMVHAEAVTPVWRGAGGAL